MRWRRVPMELMRAERLCLDCLAARWREALRYLALLRPMNWYRVLWALDGPWINFTEKRRVVVSGAEDCA